MTFPFKPWKYPTPTPPCRGQLNLMCKYRVHIAYQLPNGAKDQDIITSIAGSYGEARDIVQKMYPDWIILSVTKE